MSDFDRDREPVREPVHEPVRETERTNTTVVTTDGGRGGGGVLLAVLVILILLGVLYFVFSGSFNRAADEVGVNVNVETPKLEVPDVDVNVPDKIELKVPDEVKVETDGNKAQ